jgi:hypothetical protein
VHSALETGRTTASKMLHASSALVLCRATCISLIDLSPTLVSLFRLVSHRKSAASGASESECLRNENQGSHATAFH